METNNIWKRPSQGLIDMMNGGWEELEKERMKSISYEPIYDSDRSKDMVWVGVLNDYPETNEFVYYIPFKCKKSDLYIDVDSLPYFLSKKECQIWCDNNPYKLK